MICPLLPNITVGPALTNQKPVQYNRSLAGPIAGDATTQQVCLHVFFPAAANTLAVQPQLQNPLTADNDTLPVQPQSQPRSPVPADNDILPVQPQSQNSIHADNDTLPIQPQSQPRSPVLADNVALPVQPQTQNQNQNSVPKRSQWEIDLKKSINNLKKTIEDNEEQNRMLKRTIEDNEKRNQMLKKKLKILQDTYRD